MSPSRRDFMKTAAVAGAAVGLPACAPEAARGTDLSAAKNEFSVGPPIAERKYPPLADDAFRLPKSWHEKKLDKLREYMRSEKLAGVLLDSSSNQAYFSGLYMTRTERPCQLWIPLEGPLHMFAPGLDRDIVDTWGLAQSTYFDFKHSDPSSAEVLAVVDHEYSDLETTIYRHGPTQDLFEWMLEGVKKLGVDGNKIAVDRMSFDPREDANPRQTVFNKVFPGMQMTSIGGTINQWQLVKDESEIALVQKALDIATEIAIHCRAFILAHGTDLTDFAVRQEGERFGTELVMNTLGLAKQLEDVMPHKGV